MTPLPPKTTIENNTEVVDLLRKLLKDNAFSSEFLLTTLLEYIDNNLSFIEEN